jgi:FtsH-binding integral membrane protein
MNQLIPIALIGIILFLMWISVDLWEIHKDIAKLGSLLPSAQKSKSSKDIGNSQDDVK